MLIRHSATGYYFNGKTFDAFLYEAPQFTVSEIAAIKTQHPTSILHSMNTICANFDMAQKHCVNCRHADPEIYINASCYQETELDEYMSEKEASDFAKEISRYIDIITKRYEQGLYSIAQWADRVAALEGAPISMRSRLAMMYE